MSLFNQKVKEFREALMGTNVSTTTDSTSTDPEVKRAKEQLRQVEIRAKEKELNTLKTQRSA
jgi:uncharacterized protein YlxW (UPF0749 family)